MTITAKSWRSVWLLLLLSTALLTGCLSGKNGSSGPSTINVASASDLQPIMEKLGKEFESESGIRPVFVFGSSGQLAEQINRGGKIDLFLSADRDNVDKVIEAGRGVKESRSSYARGRLALKVKKGAALPITLEELKGKSFGKIAIANPAHAPYGRAARETLKSLKLWLELDKKLVMAENARQSLQYVESGNVDAAFVPLSLVADEDQGWMLIPEKLHAPINQTLVLIKGEKEEGAGLFRDFLFGQRAREVLKEHGFEEAQD